MLDAICKDRFFDTSVKRILYCYSEFQPIFKRYSRKSSSRRIIHFRKGIPTFKDRIFDGKRPSLLILDDLADSVNQFIADIFTKISHHRNLSVVYVCQNLFDKNRFHRTISLNSHYIVLLRNPRDTLPVSNLARQIFAGDWRFATEAYKEATRNQFSYLLFDLHPSTDERLRLRTNVFPGEQSYSYIKKETKP